MDQCYSCRFYDTEYDDLKQRWDDVSFPGEKKGKKHYCRMYEKHIDENIISGTKECKQRIEEK